MKFIKINRDILAGMQEILSLSAGYEVGIEDELEYFDPTNAISWIVAKDTAGKNIAFIRQFGQGEWSLGELYVTPEISDRKVVAEGLIAEFQKQANFKRGHRLRFDVSKSDEILNEVLIESGFSQKQELFLYFELCFNETTEVLAPKNSNQFLKAAEVAEVLDHLHPVSESEVAGWIKNGTIRASVIDSKTASVAQIYESDDAIEINRIATHPLFLRQGYAKKLVEEIILEAKMKLKKRIYLKVDIEKKPAISFYLNIGFIERSEKAQIWHSRWY
jgi:ribosomal protein S18 acetylase RimI-like enzyme